jgi:phosphoenolpyruvate carboxykinase (ATP)
MPIRPYPIRTRPATGGGFDAGRVLRYANPETTARRPLPRPIVALIGDRRGQSGARIRACQSGYRNLGEGHWNLGHSALVEQAVARGEGILAKDGPLVVETGKHTGRSAKDKFLVRDAETESTIWWDNNKSMTAEHFAALKQDFLAELANKETLFAADLHGGSQAEHRVNVRVINEFAWHNLFIRTLMVRPDYSELEAFAPDFTIIDLPSFVADPARHGCRSETVIAVSLSEKLILIGGTAYAGEMKKSVFGILNYLLPPRA